jgi:hypothetical protein
LPHNQSLLNSIHAYPHPLLLLKPYLKYKRTFAITKHYFCIKTERSQISSTPSWNEWSCDPFYQSLACLSDQKLYSLSNTTMWTSIQNILIKKILHLSKNLTYYSWLLKSFKIFNTIINNWMLSNRQQFRFQAGSSIIKQNVSNVH